jgi:UDPglucose 6-dehydrogenase
MNSGGDQDSSIIEQVLSEINKDFSESVVIVKSTVLPSIIEKLSKSHKHFVYNPEFLREKTANEDFVSANSLILGGESKDLKRVAELYNNHSDCKITDVHETDIISASLVKYSINTFLASKVIFFNQLYDISKALAPNIKWDEFITMINSDNRIGESHMDVPGHDGRLGFGGACFPKDTAALLSLSKDMDKEFSLLKEVIRINNNIRMQYNELDEREKEQGVNYKIDLE